MNENTTTSGGGTLAVSLMENEHVKELLGILKDNSRDASGLTALINHVGEMENFVKLAESRIADMKAQLDTMKEVQDHPIKSMLQSTIKALEAKVAEIKVHIAELKTNIVEGCKNAVAAFKEKGAAILDKLASFFNIKGELQTMSKGINAAIKLDDKAMAKIEAFSKEYHTTGRHLKNMGRVLIGKQPIDAVKESGKLAKVVSAPYKAHKAIELKILAVVNRMIGRLERFEEKTAAKREERAAVKAAKVEKKPTLSEKIKNHKELIKQKDLERATPERARTPGLEV
jgi:hypothetical protein